MLTKRQMTVSTGCCVCPIGACWCGRSAGGSPKVLVTVQRLCRMQQQPCLLVTRGRHRLWYAAKWTGNADTGMLGWTAGHTAGWDEVEHCRGPPADSPLLELSTNLREDLVAGEVGALNKEKVLVGAFSRHCGTSRRFVDSTTLYSNHDIMIMRS